MVSAVDPIFLVAPLLALHAKKRVRPPAASRGQREHTTRARDASSRPQQRLTGAALCAQFVPLSDVLAEDGSGNYRKLATCDLSGVRFVCETKEAGGDLYYRFSEQRLLTWMSAKVRAASRLGSVLGPRTAPSSIQPARLNTR